MKKKKNETSTKEKILNQKLNPRYENLIDKPYQLENTQANGNKIRANIRWELESKKC